MSTKVNGNVQNSATKSMPVTATNNLITNQAKAFKNVTTLVIITVIVIACWVPMWLIYQGAYMSTEIKRSILTNAADNPFIYGVASELFREDVRQVYGQTRVKLVACCHLPLSIDLQCGDVCLCY